MDDVILHKLLTLEVIVETIMDTLIEKGVVDADTLDESVINKIKQLESISKELDDEFDYSSIIMGPAGEA